jgi:hypothetical protein
MQVVGAAHTRKLFEKSLIKNFTQKSFLSCLMPYLSLSRNPACDERAKITARSSGAGRNLSG